jgi:alpha-D-ribose 1-methylphosphonate 5-triphosphate synthase subunit PhnG
MSPLATHSRRTVMGLVARAHVEELSAIVGDDPPGLVALRPPEIALVMVRGRVGGDGQAFNLGEATVTRAAVRLPSGEVGHGHVLGRAPQKARLGAIVDALWQVPALRAHVEAGLSEVDARLTREGALRRRRVAATKVDFFTMVRGE